MQVRRARLNATAASQNSQKRDLELLRRIIILLGIYLLGGIPSILFMLTSVRLIYFVNLLSPTIVVTVEKLCTVLLDREISQVIRNKMHRGTRVLPFRTQVVTLTTGQRQTTLIAAQVNV